MVEVQPIAGLPHVVFLERAARELDCSPSRFGQAAFLVLRLVDLLASDQTSRTPDDLFGYQAAATGRYCEEHLDPGPQAERLLELVRSSSYAHRRQRPSLIAPAMVDLVSWLLDASHAEEALDVLSTLSRVAASDLDAATTITIALLTGRANRYLARFDASEAAYRRAGDLAQATGDRGSVLRSLLGRSNVSWGRGNLAEAEQLSREVLEQAPRIGDRDAEARAEHGLGVVLGTRGQVPDAVPHLWRAFELYEDDPNALRALHDLGFALARLGAIESAERAFRIVLERQAGVFEDNAQNSRIELMHCASFRRDRIGFERWRGECARHLATMTPNQLTDFHLKLGIGQARFARLDRAATELQLALQIARTHRLHEFEFRIERIQARLGECESSDSMTQEIPEQRAWAATLHEVSTALAGLL
jgi:tetratricopeptide (TPR) repeat protein